MTSNQINWARAREEQRAHQATEALQAESNAVAWRNAEINAENAAVNARNAETNALNATINARNADTNAMNAQTNARHVDIEAKNADVNLLNASTRQMELALAQQQLQETIRSNKARELENTRHNVASEQIGVVQNQTALKNYYLQRTNSRVSNATRILDSGMSAVGTLVGAGRGLAGIIGLL